MARKKKNDTSTRRKPQDDNDDDNEDGSDGNEQEEYEQQQHNDDDNSGDLDVDGVGEVADNDEDVNGHRDASFGSSPATLTSTTTTSSTSLVNMIFLYMILVGLGALGGFGTFYVVFTNKFDTMVTRLDGHKNETLAYLTNQRTQAIDLYQQCQSDYNQIQQQLEDEQSRIKSHDILNARYQDLQRRYQESTARIAEIESSHQDSANQIANIQNERTAYNERITELEMELHESQNLNGKFRQENDNLVQQISNLQIQLQTKQSNSHCNELQVLYDDKIREVHIYEADVITKVRQINELELQIKSLEEEKLKLKNKMTDQRSLSTKMVNQKRDEAQRYRVEKDACLVSQRLKEKDLTELRQQISTRNLAQCQERSVTALESISLVSFGEGKACHSLTRLISLSLPLSFFLTTTQIRKGSILCSILREVPWIHR